VANQVIVRVTDAPLTSAVRLQLYGLGTDERVSDTLPVQLLGEGRSDAGINEHADKATTRRTGSNRRMPRP
jgi:hypothetical protein